MEEAVRVHNSFLYQQNTKAEDKKHSFGEKDPFMADEHEVCVRQGYLYKIWRLENKRRICIRSTVHSYKSKTETESGEAKIVYQNTYTLLEYDTGAKASNWKANLDLMMAQCLTKEVQDNSNKISRWVVQSLLAGVEHIKFAFVSRRNSKDTSKHVILGTYGIDTRSF
jgi:translation initiation factor 3 subunit D